MKFSQFFFENWWFWKTQFFSVGHFEFFFFNFFLFFFFFFFNFFFNFFHFFFQFFLLHPHKNQSKLLGYQGWVEILVITLVFSPKQPLCAILHTTICYFLVRCPMGLNFLVFTINRVFKLWSSVNYVFCLYLFLFQSAHYFFKRIWNVQRFF